MTLPTLEDAGDVPKAVIEESKSPCIIEAITLDSVDG
jgi:hypothetical protein